MLALEGIVLIHRSREELDSVFRTPDKRRLLVASHTAGSMAPSLLRSSASSSATMVLAVASPLAGSLASRRRLTLLEVRLQSLRRRLPRD